MTTPGGLSFRLRIPRTRKINRAATAAGPSRPSAPPAFLELGQEHPGLGGAVTGAREFGHECALLRDAGCVLGDLLLRPPQVLVEHRPLLPDVCMQYAERYHALAKERTMLLRCDSLEPPMHVLVGVKPERFELS